MSRDALRSTARFSAIAAGLAAVAVFLALRAADDWAFFFDELVAGVTLGSVYALVALGYSMIYGILKLLNFAHGDVYMVGAYIGYFILVGLTSGTPLTGLTATIPLALVILLMFVGAMIGCGFLGVVIERFAYRPLRDAPRIAPLITALGISFFLESSALLLFTAQFRTYDTFSLEQGTLFRNYNVGSFNIQLIRIVVIASALALMAALTLLVNRTQLGKAMRATAYDREAAAMMGIDVDRIIVAAFFIGSALAGAAGVMVGLVFQRVWAYMGFAAGLKAFTAAVVGGIGNIPGAMLGGLTIGIAEAFATGYISSTWQDAIVFSVLIAVMIVRPTGLLGTRAVAKA